MTDLWIIIGGDGLVGANLARRLAVAGRDVVVTTRRAERVGPLRLYLDLSQPPETWPMTSLPSGGVAYLCAAVALLGACEKDPEGSRLVNAERTSELARRLAARGTHVAFLSSDKVFDGLTPLRRAEDAPCPRTEYGRQKADVEAAIRQMGDRACIVRLTKVLGPRPALLESWRRDLAVGRAIHPFFDMVMSPLPVGFVAEALEVIGRRRASGVVQLSGPLDVTYAQAAQHIARRLAADAALIQPVSAASAGVSPAAAPPHTTLDTARLREELGLTPPGPWDAIDWSMAMSD